MKSYVQNQSPLAAIVLRLQELRSKLSKILDMYPSLGYSTYGVIMEAVGISERMKEYVEMICQAIDEAIRTLQLRVETHDAGTDVPGIARSLKLMVESVTETYKGFSAVLDSDGLGELWKCMKELEEISGKIGGSFLKEKQVSALEAMAFAEALLEVMKGSQILLGTKLVSYEAGQMHGKRITLATDQSCYIEASLLFYACYRTYVGDSFKGTLAVAASEDPSQILEYAIGNISFREVLQVMKIPVVEVKEPSPSKIRQVMCESLGLIVVQEDALKVAIKTIPRYLQLEPNFTARLGHLEVSTFPSLCQAYGVDPSVRKLIEMMNDLTVRDNVLSGLRKIGDENATELLIRALSDQDNNIRSAATWALGKIKNAKAVEPLIQALKDEDENVRSAAYAALGKIKNAKAVEPLIQALKDEASVVRWHAAEALGEIGDARAVEPLIQALKDEDEYVRMRAAYALSSIPDVRAVDPLIQASKDEDEHVRRAAARALGEIGDTRGVEPLVQALRDKSAGVRDNAVRSLGKMKDVRLVEILIEALKHDLSSLVRLAAAWSLGEIGDTKAVEALTQALKDKDVRTAAEYALEKIRAKKGEEPSVKLYCIYCGFQMRVEGICCPKCGKRQVDVSR